MKDKLILIADHYGLGTQLLKLAEECSEYSAASAKWNVYKNLWEQFKAMRKYKKLLEEKARLMKIDLKEIHHV